MNTKQQIIRELTSAIEDNSLRGKLTRTIYVAPFEYKSGYDTIFAIGYNENKEPIAYSYYQNDRGENLDNPIYKLESLDIDILKELKENLGKHTNDTDECCRYANAEAKNMRFITHLGLYTQPTTQKVDFHINELKKLEGGYDCYALDLFGNVSRAIYLGTPIHSEEELYYIEDSQRFVEVKEYNRKGLFDINVGCGGYHEFNEVEGIHPLYRHVLFKKNWGHHGIYDYRMFSSEKSLKELEDMLNSPDTIKYAVFPNSLKCYAFTVNELSDFQGTSAVIFDNKIDAENFFNKNRKEHLAVIKECVIMYENALKHIKAEMDEIQEGDKEDYFTDYDDLEIGKTYHHINGWDRVIYDYDITPTKKDETYGVFYQGDEIISPFDALVEESNVKSYERAEKKKTLAYRVKNLNNNIETLKSIITNLENFIPFVSENDDFECSWLKKRTIEILRENYDYQP